MIKGTPTFDLAYCQLVNRSPTVEEYGRLAQAVGFAQPDAATRAVGLTGSLFAVCAEWRDEVIGCGRVVGDGGLCWYVQDIIVLPDYQRRGVGRRMMASVMEYIDTHAQPGAFVALMAASGKAGFYLPYGFQVRPADAPGMWFIKT